MNDAILAQLAASKLGPAAGQPAPEPQAPPAPPTASKQPTQQEAAVAKVAPKEAGKEAPIEFVEIDDGSGGKRQLTHAQINGTLNRYRDLNHKWQNEVAPVSPVLAVVQKMMASAKASGHDPKGEEMAELIEAAVRAYVANPKMGNGAPVQEPNGAPTKGAKPGITADDEDDDGSLDRWEKENAVKLPPRYKEQLQASRQMGNQVQQILQLLQGAGGPAAHVNGMAQRVDQQLAQAQGLQGEATKQNILNNVKGAMMAAGLTPQDAQDFQAFSMARGYGPEDFIDPELAKTVANDFKANRDAPEIGRLREIAKRRQAFTGSVDGAPGGAAGVPAAAGSSDQMMNSIVSGAMAGRGLR
ncbi:hypothetical protein UFOVP708_2 [uncultured Caudovirales phage]|uniref:Uncharacterized protein n=1 Tax=uncultured Caudovirales phage TaxID=2100421 RepID=A0A6J5NHY3_9CAUD|nr:hypothetical protein UFOVP708_2 [uncultured Caudovirales phage]